MSQRRGKKIRRQMREQECGCCMALGNRVKAWTELERRVFGG